MVCPETLFSVRLSSKAASEAIARVHRLLSHTPELPRRAVKHPPQPLGRVRVDEGGMHELRSRGASDERASKPFSLKVRMAFLSVCEAHPRLWAILGGELPQALASSIWQRRRTRRCLWSAARLGGIRAPFPTIFGQRLEVS
jgi:hypothetical protein